MQVINKLLLGMLKVLPQSARLTKVNLHIDRIGHDTLLFGAILVVVFGIQYVHRSGQWYNVVAEGLSSWLCAWKEAGAWEGYVACSLCFHSF